MPSSVLSPTAEKKAESTTYTIPQVMMTLSQLAVTAGAQRPSGEKLKEQQARIYKGINALLANKDLATNGEWKAVWIGLTDDRANLAYIAQNTSQNAFAVCLRGTEVDSLIDLAEDLDVGTVVPFTAGPSYSETVYISKGANEAFNEVIGAVYVADNTNLLQALTSLLGDAPSQPTLYITGHSLGGAMATTVALYLAAQNWTNKPTFAVYTFAAPTAGVQSFADCFDSVFGSVSERYYNAWDAVPAAWANSSMTDMQNSFYPSIVTNPKGPGPAQNQDVVNKINNFMGKPGKNVYVQTNQKQGSVELNLDYSALGTTGFGPGSYNTLSLAPIMDSFMGQVGFQHNNYLGFLGAPQIPSLIPVISSPISPNAGPSAGGTVITIEGSNFTPDCMVDFDAGILGAVAAEEVTFVSATKITAKSPKLPLPKTVDVRVTNNFGTSATVPFDTFTAPPPASAPAVSAITPGSGPAEAGYIVTITGKGFTSDSTVYFGETPVAQEQTIIVSLTEINVQPPVSGSGTVAVTVTTTGSPGSSNTPTFTYGPPAVAKVMPSFGFLGKSDNSSVTISGAGFGSSQGNGTVQFVSLLKSHPCQSISSWSDTEIVVTPPELDDPLLVTVECDVMVTNSNGLTSDKTPMDQYTYYNTSFLKS
jgi:hypothetical protein